MLKRALIFGLPALALFICVWATRVFLAVGIVAVFMRVAGLSAIAAVAIISGLLPSIPLGFAYGLIRPRPILASAFAIALTACVLELAFASLTVPWWSFLTWWVLPTECVVVAIVFPTSAWIGSCLFVNNNSVRRRRAGASVFVVLALCALAGPWLYGCLRMGACGIGS